MTEATRAPADPLIGTRIDGRYTLRAILGYGGMGVVYDGVHDELGRAVAIKVLNTAWASDRTAVERFLREARTASSFSHGNIVDVSDLGRLPDGRPYLVMPKISGTDLNSLLGEMGPQPAKRVADLLHGVGSALDLIHAKGYVHRDIKPENLMYVVRDDGSETVMLLDFGIAKLVMSTEPRLTGQGAVFGTPHFMPPEAWGGGELDASADVYALATVVFELITGALPFESDNVVQLLSMKVGRDAPSLTHVASREFPKELEAVIARALHRRPQLRYRSASEFVNALKAATRHAPVSWRPGVLRSNLHSGQHTVERQLTPSIHVHEDAYGAHDTEKNLHDAHENGALDEDVYQESAYADDDEESMRPTQRSLPSRRTLQAQSVWTAPSYDEGLRVSEPYPYRATRAPRRTPRRSSNWLVYAALLAVAGAGLGWAVQRASTDSQQSTRSAATSSTPAAATPAAPSAPPPAATTTTAPAPAPQSPIAALNVAPAAVATALSDPSAPPAAASGEGRSPAAIETTTPAPAVTGAASGATEATRVLVAPAPLQTPALAVTAPRSRTPEATGARTTRGALSPELAPPEPPAPEPMHDEPVPAPPTSGNVLVVKQDTSAQAAEAAEAAQAPQRDSARAKQLAQQATTALLRGEVGRAVDLLSEATSVDPSLAAAWRTLGVALERSGSAPAALDAYEHYLKLAPSGPQAEMVRERMQALER
jgi:serine/threonine protein kinase